MLISKLHTHAQSAGAHGARWLRSRFAAPILAAISFAESLFLPVLIDPFLVALILARRTSWSYYTVIAIVFSLLGGIAAYFLGYWFFDTIAQPLLAAYNLEVEFTRVSVELAANGFVFVLIGALTPIPYKVVAIASGFGAIPFATFLAASIIGRILRLGLVGYIAYVVGPHALPVFRGHLLTMAYVFLFVLLGYLLVQWF
jgi:membrane protein YqaA with SNARE-associated domain